MTCGRSVVSPDTMVFSINETDHHDTPEILLEVVLNTLKPYKYCFSSLMVSMLTSISVDIGSIPRLVKPKTKIGIYTASY